MWYLIGAIVSALASSACIITTSIEFVKGKLNFSCANFWGAIIFHFITGFLAIWLALKYIGI